MSHRQDSLPASEIAELLDLGLDDDATVWVKIGGHLHAVDEVQIDADGDIVLTSGGRW